GLGARRRAEADVRAPRLEVAEIRARADFQPFTTPGRPDLDVVLHGRGEREIAGAHLDDAMREPEPAADVLRVVEQRQQLRVRRLGTDELHHLDLVELVPALDAAHVAPRGHLLAPEAARVRDVA